MSSSDWWALQSDRSISRTVHNNISNRLSINQSEQSRAGGRLSDLYWKWLSCNLLVRFQPALTRCDQSAHKTCRTSEARSGSGTGSGTEASELRQHVDVLSLSSSIVWMQHRSAYVSAFLVLQADAKEDHLGTIDRIGHAVHRIPSA